MNRIINFVFVLSLIFTIYSCNGQQALRSTDFKAPKPGVTKEIIPYEAYDLSGYGTQFAGFEPECKGRFAYKKISGDFDIFCRVENVYSSVGNCATAALMARVSEEADAPLVKVVANSYNRFWKEYDPYVMGVRYQKGGFIPENESWTGGHWYCIPDGFVNKDIPFPNCWLRLTRKGNVFTGYFAETVGIPTEQDWKKHSFSWALGGGPYGPSFIDSTNIFPEELLVGIGLEANVETEGDKISFASFRDIHGLKEKSSKRTSISVGQNQVAEISFVSEKEYESPFNDVELDVIFENQATKKKINVPAFWAGKNIWRVRFASPDKGLYNYKTVCNDLDNKSLHNVSGVVEITENNSKNIFYENGPVVVSGDQRHFCHTNGKPFFWLGDTWWMGLVKRLRWTEDFYALTKDRAEKGFNVVQLTAGMYGDLCQNFDHRSEGDGGHPWNQQFTEIVPDYFDAADKRIFHLVNNGIMPCIVGSWGYWQKWVGNDVFKKHWRYMIARWGALPVTWVLAGETTNPWYFEEDTDNAVKKQYQVWSEMLQYVQEIEPFGRMITTHPKHFTHARDEVNNPQLLDFDMQQSGHSTMPGGQAQIAYEGWNKSPQMPVISGEARYEKLTLKNEWVSSDENLDQVNSLAEIGTKQARQAFWSHTLASGCAGHTYGASGIFQVNTDDWKFGQSYSGVDWGRLSWKEAMVLPGSKQLGIAKKLLEKYEWQKLEPFVMDVENAVSHASTPDKNLVIIYTTNGQEIKIKSSEKYKTAIWFDPVNGAEIQAKQVIKDNISTFKSPGANSGKDNDWVLLLKK